MSALFELTIRLVEPSWKEGAVGLLLPFPPETVHQRPVESQLPTSWTYQEVRAVGSPQRAALVTAAGELTADCRYAVAQQVRPPEPASYRPVTNRFTALPEDLAQVVQRLGAEGGTDAAKVRRAAEYVTSRFVYNSTPSSGAYPDVVCDIKSGNCLDINTVFLSVLYGLGIPASYDIGYYFEGDKPECDGWHCWVSALVDGRHEDWDVPHHMKFSVAPLREGLNPHPGRRVLMSRGRGLRFPVQGREVEISHFCRPRWVLRDGATVEAPMRGFLNVR